MFHKIKTSKVLYAFFGILVLYFFSYSFFWQPFIIKRVNSALNKFDISVQSVNMSGNLLFDIKGRELQVRHPSLGNIFIDNFTINVDYVSSLFGVTSFDKIFIEGILIDSTRRSFENNNFKIQEFPIKIDMFSLGGQIPIQFQKEVMLLNGYVEGKVLWKDELKLDLTRLSLKNKGDNSILFQMDDFDLIANTDSLIIKSFSGKIGNAPVKGKMVYLEK
ncbi:MAG: hypothetical protein P8O00_04180, partial [Candidatus Marinimicrobia bacterium]|nr:hypothetical protein [Candidatus Neomarinimicrobiota bacterium]